MPVQLLQDFIQQVPLLTPSTRLQTMLEQFKAEQGCLSASPGLVCLDENCHPIGWVYPLPFLSFLLTQPSDNPSLTWGQVASTLTAPLITPLPKLPASLPLVEFRSCLAHLQEQSLPLPPAYALVDRDNRYLGILNPLTILPLLSSPPTELSTPGLVLLEQVLESLPLPLMLQTGTGQVVMQNALWQQQIGHLLNTGQINRDINQLLHSDTELVGVCHWNRERRGLICQGALADGQQQWWQFSTLSLGDSPCTPRPEIAPLCPVMALGSPDPQPPNSLWLNGPIARNVAPPDSLWLVLAEPIESPDAEPRSAVSVELQPTRANSLPSQSNAIPADRNQPLGKLEVDYARLSQLNLLKDELLADISHELKTPLTAILGLASVLQGQGLGSLTPRQFQYVQLIHRSGRQLMALVNDVVDLIQLETGQVELNSEVVELRPLAQKAYQLAQQLQSPASEPHPQRQEDFQLTIEAGLETAVVADPLQLRRMLVHLLRNALQSTPVGSKLGLRVNRWSRWVALTVWDQGKGIALQHQPLIFQHLRRTESSSTQQLQGNGLGLMLTRKLARLHGGELSFISQMSRGSEFTLLLPAPPSLLQSSPALPELPLILVVDPNLSADLTAQLRALPWAIVLARSGLEAVEKARQLQPQLILLNPTLPPLTGWELLPLLKSDPITAQQPVVIMAAVGEEIPQEADGILSLPLQRSALEQLLTRLIRLEQPLYPWNISPALTRDPLPTQAEIPALADLTVLRLGCNRIPHLPYCRVLEADDLEQAELLARIWQPDVLLWDWLSSNPFPDLRELSQHEVLSQLPLVTLDRATTCAANQVPGLKVFPCLAIDSPNLLETEGETATLWQVLQVAAGRL